MDTADSCVRRAAALCEDGAEAWTCTRHGKQSAAALAAAAGLAATDARVRAKLAALAGAVTVGYRQGLVGEGRGPAQDPCARPAGLLDVCKWLLLHLHLMGTKLCPEFLGRAVKQGAGRH